MKGSVWVPQACETGVLPSAVSPRAHDDGKRVRATSPRPHAPLCEPGTHTDHRLAGGGAGTVYRPGHRDGGPNPASHADELARLIAEQAHDDEHGHRVWSCSLDALPSGADLQQRERRLRAHDDRHGTVSFYVSHRCRCDKCRAASAAYARERRRRLKAQA